MVTIARRPPGYRGRARGSGDPALDEAAAVVRAEYEHSGFCWGCGHRRRTNERAVRNTDPETSHQGNISVSRRRHSQHARILEVLSIGRHMNSDEIKEATGISQSSSLHTRCGELEGAGFIIFTGKTRVGIDKPPDTREKVYRITAAGCEHWRRIQEGDWSGDYPKEFPRVRRYEDTLFDE
jgi:hypothetical protein